MSSEPCTPDFAREALHYDPVTGLLRWRFRPRHHFARGKDQLIWNVRFAGKEAFSGTNRYGYRVGGLNGKARAAHRVIWLIVHGIWPAAQVDHKNGVRNDNRIDNLRICTNQQNSYNRRPDNGAVGLKGVTEKSGRYRARIHNHGRDLHLGDFDTPEEAHAAYCAAAADLFGEFARTV